MSDPERAWRYHVEELTPGMRGWGFPEYVIERMREQYVEDAVANPAAVEALRMMYPEYPGT